MPLDPRPVRGNRIALKPLVQIIFTLKAQFAESKRTVPGKLQLAITTRGRSRRGDSMAHTAIY